MDLWAAWKRIWTITRHSIVQAMRMWIVLVAVVFVVILLLAMPFLLKTDRTQIGQARMVITYSVWLINILLCVLTLFLAPWVVWAEVKGRQILVLDPKPVGRAAVLFGKWLGVMFINAALLFLMMAVTYLLVRYYVGRPPQIDPRWPRDQQVAVLSAYEEFRANVFTARNSIQPPPPEDLEKRVEEEIKRLRERNAMPETQSETYVRNEIRERLMRGAWSVAPQETIEWKIGGVKGRNLKGEYLIFEFTHFGPADRQDYRIPGVFVINPGGQPVVRIPYDPDSVLLFRAGKANRFPLPTSVIDEHGVVTIRYTNYDRNGVNAQFPYMGGVQIQYPASGLAANFARTGLILLCQLAFLTSVGICAATFLSFPVASLTTVTVFVVGLLHQLLFSKMLPNLYLIRTQPMPPWSEEVLADVIIRQGIGTFFRIFPNLLASDVVDALSQGVFIGTGICVWKFIWLVAFRAVPVLLFGWWIFRRRELAIFGPNA